MNKLQNNHLFSKLTRNDKEQLCSIKIITKKLLPNGVNIIHENQEKNFDNENGRYSYTLVINSDSKSTQNLNIKFIEYCIKNFPNILINNIVFKFESGLSDGY